jgi:hypothetical protein
VSLITTDGSLKELADLWGRVEIEEASPWYMDAKRGTNNTGELSGLGQSLLWLRDVDNTTRTAVILYDSIWAYNNAEEWRRSRSCGGAATANGERRASRSGYSVMLSCAGAR